MHAMHNFLPTFFGNGGLVLMLLISWAIDILFFVLLELRMSLERARAKLDALHLAAEDHLDG